MGLRAPQTSQRKRSPSAVRNRNNQNAELMCEKSKEMNRSEHESNE